MWLESFGNDNEAFLNSSRQLASDRYPKSMKLRVEFSKSITSNQFRFTIAQYSHILQLEAQLSFLRGQPNNVFVGRLTGICVVLSLHGSIGVTNLVYTAFLSFLKCSIMIGVRRKNLSE